MQLRTKSNTFWDIYSGAISTDNRPLIRILSVQLKTLNCQHGICRISSIWVLLLIQGYISNLWQWIILQTVSIYFVCLEFPVEFTCCVILFILLQLSCSRLAILVFSWKITFLFCRHLIYGESSLQTLTNLIFVVSAEVPVSITFQLKYRFKTRARICVA